MKKILVVDDDPGIREYYFDLLTANGYEVVSAPDGESGLKIIESENVDLVLLDVNMPGKSGMDILKEIKTTREKLPVFLLTAHESYKRNFLSLYAEEFIPKAKRPEILLKRIKLHLEL